MGRRKWCDEDDKGLAGGVDVVMCIDVGGMSEGRVGACEYGVWKLGLVI